MTTTPLKTRIAGSVAALALGMGLAAFAFAPSSFAADWHDRDSHAFHGPVFHDGRGYYRGGFGFGLSFADPYPYYAYGYPYAYGDPYYAYPPPPVAMIDPAAPTYTASNGQTCRDYPTTRVVNGMSEQILSTACLQPDGSWQVVN